MDCSRWLSNNTTYNVCRTLIVHAQLVAIVLVQTPFRTDFLHSTEVDELDVAGFVDHAVGIVRIPVHQPAGQARIYQQTVFMGSKEGAPDYPPSVR